MSDPLYTAAVVRDGTHHVFTNSIVPGGRIGNIAHRTFEGYESEGKQRLIEVDGQSLKTTDQSPLAATVVWDNRQINVYYFALAAHGAWLQEVCQNGDTWIEGSLGDYLRNEAGVVPHLLSTITVWNEKEQINVYFRESKDGDKEMTLAQYNPGDGWSVKKVKF